MINNKSLFIILFAVATLLLIPLIAIQFTDEVNWTLSDFVVAGALLLGTGLVLDFVIRKVKNRKSRIIIILVIFIFLLLIWAELAVGIFGTPIAGN